MQVLKFLGAGGIATIVQYLVLAFSVEILAIGATVASAFAYACGGVVNYFINYYVTFDSDSKHLHAALKFTVVAVIGLVINTTIMFILVEQFHIFYLLSQVLATIIVTIWNYFAHKLWTYAAS